MAEDLLGESEVGNNVEVGSLYESEHGPSVLGVAFLGSTVASTAKSLETMQVLISLLAQIDSNGLAKVEALMVSIRGRDNPGAALVAARAKARAPATGAV